jgi:hypothetical protein
LKNWFQRLQLASSSRSAAACIVACSARAPASARGPCFLRRSQHALGVPGARMERGDDDRQHQQSLQPVCHERGMHEQRMPARVRPAAGITAREGRRRHGLRVNVSLSSFRGQLEAGVQQRA